LKKYCCWLFVAALACLPLPAPLLPAHAQAQNVDMAQNIDMQEVKAALLNDPLFLSHLRDRLSVDTLDDEHIRQLVRAYLLDNPEMLIEMQEVLMARNETEQAQNAQDAARIINDNAAFLFDNEADIILGNEQGDIKIVEFYDYNCGYCKASYLEVLRLLEQDGHLSLVMKDFPILGEDSARAHLVARAVKKLTPQHYPSFHHQMMLLEKRATEESALEVALSFGIDRQQLQQTMTLEEIQIDLIDNAKIAYLLGFNFTPAYIVGEETIRGAVDNEHMATVIDRQRQAKEGRQ